MAKASVIRLPPNGLFEIEFTPGVWTNVTADVDQSISTISLRFGRSSEFSAPQVAEFTVALRNFDKATGVPTGKYTPRSQASPYWPNIQPRKRIRYSYNTGVQRVRFFGYINQWQPMMLDSYRPAVTITASDRSDQLSRATMMSPLMTEMQADGPLRFWPLTDASADTQTSQTAADASLNKGMPLRLVAATQATLTFGDTGPGFGDGSGVRFSPNSVANGQYLTGDLTGVSLDAFTLELWVNAGTVLPAWVTATNRETVLGIDRARDAGFLGRVRIGIDGRPIFAAGTASVSGPQSILDAGWHHIVVTRATSGGACSLYVDGTLAGATVSSPAITDMDTITVGEGALIGQASSLSPSRFQGNAGYAAIYDYALSGSRITAHHDAGGGYFADTVDARIARYLAIAGLTSSDWTLDASTVAVNHYPQDGKDVLSACQDMVTTEGGGAAFYVTPSGVVRFVNRRYRDNRTPKLTINAVDDLDGSVYSPTLDDHNLENQATVDRSAESGSLSTQIASVQDSIDQFGLFSSGTTTSYTTSDQDALNLAQYRAAANAYPALRYQQLSIDLATAGHDLYDAVGQVVIGDRLRLTNLPAAASPVPTLDFFIEGWTEAPGEDSYKVTFDVSPVDYRWRWDVSRWAPDPGVMTLNALIAPAATSLAVATASGPTCTTTSGFYPVTVRFGEEDIILNTAPGGSTSPQTFTGVTRGANGTLAAQQAAGSVMSLSPPDGWAL